MKRALSVMVFLAFAARPVAASGVQPGVYDYLIHHSIHGLIGRHEMTVRRDGERLTIEHDNEIEVGILFTVAYRREAHYREVWQNGRLVRFESRTNDDGELLEVTAHAEGDRLVIEGPNGVIEAPAETAPTQPSHVGAIDRRWFMKVGTGELLEANVEHGERDEVMVAHGQIEATPYRLSGDLDQEVWFDDAGVFVKWLLPRGGGTVTMMRE